MSNSIEQNKKENDLDTSDNATSNTACDAPVIVQDNTEQKAWAWWRSLGESKRQGIGLSNYGKTLPELYEMFHHKK